MRVGFGHGSKRRQMADDGHRFVRPRRLPQVLEPLRYTGDLATLIAGSELRLNTSHARIELKKSVQHHSFVELLTMSF